jgi:apolipoprotein N-acyltransferase
LRLKARSSFLTAAMVSAAAGIASSAAFPPIGLWPLAFVGLVPLLWALEDETSVLRRLLLGSCFGFGFFGATLWWILRFGLGAWMALTVVSAIVIGIFAICVPLVRRHGHAVVTACGTAALWTVLDWIRGMWPLGGFTWGTLGVSQVANPATSRVATLAGVWGVTFVVVAVNALLFAAMQGRVGQGIVGERRARPALLMVIAITMVLLPVAIPFTSPNGQQIRIATIQVDVHRDPGLVGSAEDEEVAAMHVTAHRSLKGDPPDLVIWGEGALDPGASSNPGTVEEVRRVIAEVGSPTLIGAVTDDPDGRQRTDALLLDERGTLVDRYDKVHLVPFGEYVPFRSRLGWIGSLRQIPIDRAPGESVHTLTTAGLPSFGTPICFENAFPSLVRRFVQDGADFLVVPVNNASYGRSAASAQHLQMSQMRAIETGRWVVNAAVSGVSAFVNPRGEVVSEAGLFEDAVLQRTIVAADERTWYVRLGDVVPWLSLGLVVGLAGLPRSRTRRRDGREQMPADARAMVILPTYEERATIGAVLRGVLDTSPGVEVLVVDDASPDGTAEIVRDAMATEPRVHLLERPSKSGLASAYLDGFELALREGFDLIVEMDSDLSHDPSQLAGLLKRATADADLVVGSRYIPGGSVTDWGRMRVALSRSGNRYARLLLGIPIHDATSGYRVYRADLLDELLRLPLTTEGYGFQIELVLRAWLSGGTVVESPITFREREHGHSKISRRIVVEALWQVTRWGMRMRFSGPDAVFPA